MEPILSIDIGAGTTDILVFYPDTKQHYKAVLPSPIRKFANFIKELKTDLLISGTIMGGGAVSAAVVQHAQKYKVFMTPGEAKTIHDDLKKVAKKGIIIISDKEKARLRKENLTHLIFGDVCLSDLRVLLKKMGIERNFSYIGGAVQDHGVPPKETTSIDFRHQFMKEIIEKNPKPESFLFSLKEIPSYLTRMKSTGKLLSQIPQHKVFMMDTGMAAVVGVCQDDNLKECSNFLVADIGNSHTLGACISDGLVGGFFEYHTDNLTPGKIEKLFIGLANGNLEHHKIIAEGGHGAYIRFCPGWDKIEKIVVTGPRRKEIMEGVKLKYWEGAPWGDTMMAGAVGLIEAIRYKEKLNIVY